MRLCILASPVFLVCTPFTVWHRPVTPFSYGPRAWACGCIRIRSYMWGVYLVMGGVGFVALIIMIMSGL